MSRISSGLGRFVKTHRVKLSFGADAVRIVYHSCLMRKAEDSDIAGFFAQKAIDFYRPIPEIIRDMGGGYILTTFKETLARLPTVESFQESHFGEIAATLFAEEILSLKRIYSKLSLLTSENTNAFKIDLLLYDPNSDPVELVLAEVKSSPKSAVDGLPARHDQSCYSSLFDSFREYDTNDLEFDLTAVKDRLHLLPEEHQERIRDALRPYSQRKIRFAGFVVIDASTLDENEARVLWKRRSSQEFDVDLVCIEELKIVSHDSFGRLGGVLEALRQACS